ncbi:MAG TPA: glycoside hydrolase family 2 TIM barrel-domain containing protein, partial [Candidatus Methylacidiphilales bacterium]|nr:glycoside hydrolase family 2 TIM barrel-domain containing protein [Candidatus Methylacidiphilales bacterium]
RLATDGDDTFLGVAPLDFKPQPGTWYTLRAVVQGDRFQIFVNDEKVPRINVVDSAPVWNEGGVSLGGGWLPVEYRNVTIQDVPASATVSTETWQPPAIDREARRAQQRAAYQPVTIDKLGPDRTEIALDGKWLFFPDQDLPAGAQPLAPDFDDSQWHVMDVPAMWTPCLSWLYGETGFKLSDDLSASKGICDRLFLEEQDRLNNYTFDWKKTKSAWYRHYINLPAGIAGRHVELDFDAIAKVSEVWVNGVKVGSHTGMFGEIDCDLTAAVHPGKNVVAVHVVGVPPKKSDNQVMGVAVTVEVTASMLNSLPHGMFRDEASGIWQPVKLVVTSPVAVDDVYIRPRLDGADFDVTLRNTGTAPAQADIGYTIRSAKDSSVLDASAQDKPLDVPAGATATLTISTPALKPKLWTPADPNLYQLDLQVSSGGAVVDKKSTEFGFRTFTTDKNHFLLNGKPYWLRGADHFPSSLRPNDAVLARKFLEMAKEGNVRITRSHTVPMTETWLTAADEVGMGVSYEGTWPWLMLKGDPPSEDLLKVWKDEFASLLHKYRNHPSILIWTVNNEMKFAAFDKKNPDLLKKKWAIVSDMIKTMRQIDPTRPIVADSSYVRKDVGTEYEDIIKANGFDDGDVDDTHTYPGWYNPSFFHLFHGEFGAKSSPDRPFISQEMSTGYSRNDDGHPVRAYLFNHHTPQALIGDEAYENRDPSYFLTRLAFMTKELAETIRRADRSDCAGTFHFAYLSWFKDVWNADTIAPWPAYSGLQVALQPVLVSAELFGRHFYAGADVHRRVCVINDADDFSDLPAGTLTWEIRAGGQSLAQGSMPVDAVPYYSNKWLDVDFKMPETLPSPRVDAQLVLKLMAGGTEVSHNSYDIVLATPAWAAGNSSASPGKIAVFDPEHKADAVLQGVDVSAINSLDDLNAGAPGALVIGDAGKALADPAALAAVKQYVSSGGRVLLLNAGKALPAAFPDQIAGYRATNSGEVATMHVPESPVFDGLEPLDMSWFELGEGHLPNACTGYYTINRGRDDVTALADHCDIHGYLKKKGPDLKAISGSPLVEIDLGKGAILSSEMDLEAAPNDPVAKRLVCNLLAELRK